jgi:hypothetical protein
MVYDVAFWAKEGDKTPPVMMRLLRSALVENGRVTFTLYVVMLVPSCAVTATGTVTVAPSATAICADA